MCITKFINSISNCFISKYYNTYNFNELYDLIFTTITIKSFSKLATVYDNTNKTNHKQVAHLEECLEYPETTLKKRKIIDLPQELYMQIIYHNLTYDHGIYLLN